MKAIMPEGGFRTQAEKEVGRRLEEVFERSSDPTEVKLDNFTKYIRRQKLTRLLSLYEILKKILQVKGSIIDCGVYQGFSLMAWAHMSSILEPTNLTRRIYGFDTFEGFPSVGEKDLNNTMVPGVGQLNSNSFEELSDLIGIYDSNRYLGHINKVQLIKGDVSKTIPDFVANNKHIVISLLFLDLDLFLPVTRAAAWRPPPY